MARNSYTETTRKGFGKRMSDSIGGAIFGGLIFIASFPALWWNEGRAIGEYTALKEGAGAVVHASAGSIDSGNEGKLVHVSERVIGDPQILDPELAVSVDGLALRRVVEMYQWKESKESREKKTLGGGSETVTEYTYDTEWDDDAIDSSDFSYSTDHANPTEWPVESASFEAATTTIGAYTLSGSARASVGAWRDLDAGTALNFPDAFEGFRRVGGSSLFLGANPDAPEVGDVRIRFQYQPEEVFSIVARQTGDRLDAYTTRNGRSVLLVESGDVAADKMFEGAQRRNSIITWVIRAVGTLAMWMGLSMVFAPISRVLDILPMLGTIGSWGIALVTGLLSLMLSVLTIGISWIFYRPVLGISLIAIAIGLIVWSRRRSASTPASAPSMMPPSAPMAPPPPPSMPPPPPPV